MARPIAVAAAIVAVIAASAAAWAVQVEITTVRAAEYGPSDAQLVEFRPRLRRLVGYRSFQVVRTERRACAWQTTEAFKIPGGHLLNVVPRGMRDQTVVMQVKLLDRRRPLVDTDVRLQNRGVMLFGLGHEANVSPQSALIIMLKAEE